ncbi:NADPH-dependent FMN reductase [Kutzneria sp. 744]|uniref:NADPH-dependent FMN reductase n=1 Tax=Kutzneria sp. (strain 744) TaxID=345341 RepID=UPI0003EEBE3E|nr:NAD(P)H-dependent oxidoreductase [Kutzneria sp. 744]EWM12681.1 FMN reductase [Kutzneria sp. 744]
MSITSGVLVGNPRPASRTLNAALALRDALHRVVGDATAGPVVDAAELAEQVFTPGATAVKAALEALAATNVLVVASPTYKASYTGLLKAVLDQLPGGALKGVVAVPLQVAASDKHALSVDLHLRPVLVELGATVPGAGVFVNEARLTGDQDTLTKELAEELESTGTANTLRALLAR